MVSSNVRKDHPELDEIETLRGEVETPEKVMLTVAGIGAVLFLFFLLYLMTL
jgi:hypothetical protein